MAEYYELQREKLGKLEQLNMEGKIDLYYGDETHVCSEGYVPYGWQFPGEDVCILSEKAYKINCFEFINRQSQCRWKTTESNIDTEFVLEFLENFSFEIKKRHLLYWIMRVYIGLKLCRNACPTGRIEDCIFSFSLHILHI